MLRIIYNDKHSNFEELLVKDKSSPYITIPSYKAAKVIFPDLSRDNGRHI